MGLDYAFDILIPPEQDFAVWQALARHCRDTGERQRLQWPDGREVLLPGSADAWKEPECRSFGARSNLLGQTFCLSLLFDGDPLLEEYARDQEIREPGFVFPRVGNQLAVGCIYTTCQAAHSSWPGEYWSFTFAAATTDMSRLFVESAAVHAFFLALVRETGAVGWFLDLEDGRPRRLWWKGQTVPLYSPLQDLPWPEFLQRIEKID